MDFSNPMSVLGAGLCAGYVVAKMFKDSSGAGKLELMYWNGRGLMEVPRKMLALSGLFPGAYIDGRYTTDNPPTGGAGAMSEVADKLSWNLGRMPLVKGEDGEVGQSVAINYYVAAKLGLLGDSVIETAHILFDPGAPQGDERCVQQGGAVRYGPD
jgi:hypothetical protein